MEHTENILDAIKFPELVIGLAGAIGSDMGSIFDALTAALQAVGYRSVPIHISAEIASERSNIEAPVAGNLAAEMDFKMSHANDLCRKHDAADALMLFAIRAIRNKRAAEAQRLTSAVAEPAKEDLEGEPLPEHTVWPKTAYIIRQLKRPEEVFLLRKIYGKQFILISAYASATDRKRILSQKLKRSLPLNTSDTEIEAVANALIVRDENESLVRFGQNLPETFPLADVFLDGVNRQAMEAMISRFVNVFFGRTDMAPTKGEYGMYAAKSASLRSSDLSRQVGAAIFTSEGELITQGCNEVPKAFGGTYWDGEEPDFRDVKIGFDPNDVLKREIVRDLLERLDRGGLLSDEAKRLGTPAELVDTLIKKPPATNSEIALGCLSDSAVMELTEYGRVVHAEMCAICDAARTGRSVKGATLYVTTFPCHNCTKHILAAGLRRVIYVEPYPKSKAKELHDNEIELEKSSETRVSFLPFLGISPVRYRDVFQKGKRKRDGAAMRWIEEGPRPMIDSPAPTYLDLEDFELARLFANLKQSEPAPPQPASERD